MNDDYKPTPFDIIAVELGGTVTKHIAAVKVVEHLARHGYAIVSCAWERIETAPKDGTDVLIYDGNRYVAAWDKHNILGWCYGDQTYQPTHWMPLPEAALRDP